MRNEKRDVCAMVDGVKQNENNNGAWRIVAAQDVNFQRVESNAVVPGTDVLGYLELWRPTNSVADYQPIFESTIEQTLRISVRNLFISLRLRASRPEVQARIVASSENTRDGTFSKSIAVTFTLGRDWQTKEFSIAELFEKCNTQKLVCVRLIVEVCQFASGTLVEVEGARLGERVSHADPQEAKPRSAPSRLPLLRKDSSYLSANILEGPILVCSPQGLIECGPMWKLQAGRGGGLRAELAQVDVSSDIDYNAIHRPAASQIHFRVNEHYARLRYALKPQELLQSSNLALHLWARCTAGTVRLETYLIFSIDPAGEHPIKIGAATNLNERWATIDRTCDIDADSRGKVATAKNCHLILQFTGVGMVELYSPWLGSVPKSTPGLQQAWTPYKAFFYDQFIYTAEPIVPSANSQPCAVVVQCPSGHASEVVADQVFHLLRSRHHSIARALVLVDSADFDERKFRQNLLVRLSRAAMERVDIKLVNGFDSIEATAAVNSFVNELAPDTFTLFIEIGDQLREDFAAVLAQHKSDIVVFDHDHLGPSGRRERPILKPGLSSHLLIEYDFVAGAAAFRARMVATMLRPPYAGTPMRREVLRALRGVNQATIEKIDAILLHRAHSLATDPVSNASFAREMIEEARLRAEVIDRGNRISVRYRLEHEARVSLVILFRDKVEYLVALVDSIFATSTYCNYELILVNNQSQEAETYAYLDTLTRDCRVHVVPFNEAFNYSRMNNFGASAATGDFLIFMNNDMRVVTPDWIETMIGYAGLADVGFVGAKLQYANGRIQHGGVVVGLKGLAGHALEGCHDIASLPLLSMHSREVSAVTGAAMCIERRKLENIGPFDERFIVTGNDVEISLRATAKGYHNIFLGDIQLFHYEKTTRSAIPVNGYDIALSLEAYGPHLIRGDRHWNKLASLVHSDGSPRRFGEPTGSVRSADARAARVAAIVGRNSGSDATFIARHNLRRATIENVIAANAEYAGRADREIRSIAWLLPMVDHIYRGGVFTAFRFAAASYRSLGAVPYVVLCSDRSPDCENVRSQLEHAFPGVPFVVRSFNPTLDNIASLPRTDAAVATLWTTAYHLAEYPCGGRFYLIQDYEPLFLAEHAGYGLIETTYQMGLFPICNSSGVGDAIRSYAKVPMLVFSPAVDRTIFRPRCSDAPAGSPVQIVFYGRPSNRRNIFGMGVQALLEVKQRYRDAVNIVSVGAEYDPQQFGAEGQITNAGLLPSMESVAALYRASDIGVVFMQSKHPSYQPLEYMASGCVTVTNRNYANNWLLRDRENCLLTPITLDAIAETISEAVADAELRKRIVQAGFQTVSNFDWKLVEDRVTRFLTDPTDGGSFAYKI